MINVSWFTSSIQNSDTDMNWIGQFGRQLNNLQNFVKQALNKMGLWFLVA